MVVACLLCSFCLCFNLLLPKKTETQEKFAKKIVTCSGKPVQVWKRGRDENAQHLLGKEGRKEGQEVYPASVALHISLYYFYMHYAMLLY